MSVATSINYINISNNEPDSIQARISSKSVIIPASVVEISDNSFENSIVESIIFMNNSQLKTIGKTAFKNCKFLKSIQIPASVVEITDEAFSESSLEEITFTNDSQLKTIGKGAFRNCKFLKSVTIPDSVTRIESTSFLNSAIEKVFFGANSQCTTIGQNAFQYCRFLKSIEIPSSVLKIEESAFAESNIQTILFADNSRLETIGRYALEKCKSLQSIKIPSSVVVIGIGAFAESTIKEILFSDDSKLEILSDFIFEMCPSLESITIPSSVLKIDELAFSQSGIREVLFSDNSNLKTIGKSAFCQTYLFKCLQIPMSVVEIDECAFEYSTVPEIIFAEKSKLKVIHSETFSNCKLKSIKIPDSVVMIAEKAFSNSHIEEVIFSVNSKLEIISKKAFFECKSLKSFIFPQSLREIGSFAFSFCRLPKSIKLLSTSVDFLGDPFTNSPVDEIIFGNSGKIQTTAKNNRFLQLCSEGDVSKCREYVEHNDVNLSYTTEEHTRRNGSFSHYIDDAMSIAMSTNNIDLITFLIKNKILMYSHCKIEDTKNCFIDDDIIERVLFENATVFWYTLCSFVMKKVYKLIRRVLEMLKSKEYAQEWINIFKNSHQNILPQLLTQGDSLHFYHFLIVYDLINIVDLEEEMIKKYFYLASHFGNDAVFEITREILPKKNFFFYIGDIFKYTSQDKLYPMIKSTLPYIMKEEYPLGLIIEGRFENEDDFVAVFPETVLSYLAYTQAFDTFKYIVENVSTTKYTPSHLVACSLFRGYNDAKEAGKVDKKSSMDFFDYILQDNIRPHVLGKDKEWIGKSIFTCIEYASPEMCMKLFSYEFDKDDIYIDIISDDKYNSLIRYSLLSYACKYQSLEVVQCLIDKGVSIDGLLPNHVDSSNDLDNDDEDGDGDGDEIEGKIENKYMDEGNKQGGDSSDDDDFDDDFDNHNDENNPKCFILAHFSVLKGTWFEPYFNPYRVNKNQDVDIYYYKSRPYYPSIEDPLERFLKSRPHGYLTLLNVTPLGVAIYVQNLDIVRLLLKNGANPNTNTFSGFPHLFVLGVIEKDDEVINLDRNYRRMIQMESSADVEQLDEQREGKKMKMEDEDQDEDEDEDKEEDVYVSISVPGRDNLSDTKFAIFQELVNHGANLFHKQTVYYVTDGISSRRFNIKYLCTHLNYSLNLLKYLQKIPQLGDKIKKYYIDSFHSDVVNRYSRSPLFSVDTIDYMFQNGYLSCETYQKDAEFRKGIESRSKYKYMIPVLEKYGFNFANDDHL